ncbi:MAG TPA: hypothetical protein VHX61_17880 [Rhizomicrobium sp.]|nr:hypothetical protein [Rhizomicrobium sp.]
MSGISTLISLLQSLAKVEVAREDTVAFFISVKWSSTFDATTWPVRPRAAIGAETLNV